MFGKLNVHNLVVEMEENKACHLIVVLTYNSQCSATTQLLLPVTTAESTKLLTNYGDVFRRLQRLGPLQNGSCSSNSARKV